MEIEKADELVGDRTGVGRAHRPGRCSGGTADSGRRLCHRRGRRTNHGGQHTDRQRTDSTPSTDPLTVEDGERAHHAVHGGDDEESTSREGQSDQEHVRHVAQARCTLAEQQTVRRTRQRQRTAHRHGASGADSCRWGTSPTEEATDEHEGEQRRRSGEHGVASPVQDRLGRAIRRSGRRLVLAVRRLRRSVGLAGHDGHRDVIDHSTRVHGSSG